MQLRDDSCQLPSLKTNGSGAKCSFQVVKPQLASRNPPKVPQVSSLNLWTGDFFETTKHMVRYDLRICLMMFCCTRKIYSQKTLPFMQILANSIRFISNFSLETCKTLLFFSPSGVFPSIHVQTTPNWTDGTSFLLPCFFFAGFCYCRVKMVVQQKPFIQGRDSLDPLESGPYSVCSQVRSS